MSKNIPYFPHDSNARHDLKCSALISVFGMKGYGVFWAIAEILHQQGGKIEKFPKFLEGISSEIKSDKNAVEEILRFLIDDCKLLKENDEIIWSERVLRNFEEIELKRVSKVESGRIGGMISGSSRSKTKQCFKQTKQNEAPLQKIEANEAKERKGKETKLKEIKGKETKEDDETFVSSPDTFSEIEILKVVDREADYFSETEREIISELKNENCELCDFEAAYQKTVRNGNPKRSITYLRNIVREQRDIRLRPLKTQQDEDAWVKKMEAQEALEAAEKAKS